MIFFLFCFFFHIFHHICSKWQPSEPHIMYYTIFGSSFSTHLPLGVNQASLQIKGAQDPGLRITTLVQFCKFSSHWRMNDGSNLSSHWSKKCLVHKYLFRPYFCLKIRPDSADIFTIMRLDGKYCSTW